MIPFLKYKKAVDRLIKAVQARDSFDTLDKGMRQHAEFEYRDAKRALYDLGKLLITGEVPNRGMK